MHCCVCVPDLSFWPLIYLFIYLFISFLTPRFAPLRIEKKKERKKKTLGGKKKAKEKKGPNSRPIPP